MRLERSVVGGVSFVNDAYNANPESAIAAFRAFSEVAGAGSFSRRVLILGDMLELGEGAPALHAEVGSAAAPVRADLVIVVGEISRSTADGLASAGWKGRLERLTDLDGGRDAHAAVLLQAGDLVLLKGSRRMGLERVIKAMEGLARTMPVEAAAA
jgi:UDP-N-acetylmuramoyl-tripeptide--D-alanyl-D-alanine ligase